jgi:hypothetical protein
MEVADAIYNYITCSGTFVNNFLGGFEFVEVCAQTNSANADSIITITATGLVNS